MQGSGLIGEKGLLILFLLTLVHSLFLLLACRAQSFAVIEYRFLLNEEEKDLVQRCVSVSSYGRFIPCIAEFEQPVFVHPEVDPKTVASVILDGGAGTRLFPLTSRRAKPAVPIGGCYRLIDVPMSNCINSGVLAATQTPGEAGKKWFQGTADAMRQFIWVFEDAKNKNVEHILILSGDHLYRMNYMDFVQKHADTNADLTVSCIPMDDSRASDFGLMKIDETGRIIQFAEKPKGSALKTMIEQGGKVGIQPSVNDVWSCTRCEGFRNGTQMIRTYETGTHLLRRQTA